MHRQHSKRTVKSLHLGALHFLINSCLVAISTGCVISGFVLNNDDLLMFAAASGITTIVSIVVFFIAHIGWQCPLCMGKIWAGSRCRRHRNAKKALGISYRLHIAKAVLFSKSYRCPYCGEPFSTRRTRR